MLGRVKATRVPRASLRLDLDPPFARRLTHGVGTRGVPFEVRPGLQLRRTPGWDLGCHIDTAKALIDADQANSEGEMKGVWLALLIGSACVGALPAYAITNTGAPAMIDVGADVQDALTAVLAAQERSWNAGDATAFCASATPDVVFTNIVGMFSVGHAPFEAQHAHIFSTIYKGSRLKQSLVHIALLKPDVAIVDTLTELTGYSHLPPGSEALNGMLKTRLEQVMVLKDGRWWVASFHNVSVNPSVSGPPPPN